MTTSKQAQRVVLIELMGQVQSFNLPHEQYCAESGACSCTTKEIGVAERDPQTGVMRRRGVPLRTPKSITLAPKGESKPLNAAVLKCDEVAAALKSQPRRIRSEPV